MGAGVLRCQPETLLSVDLLAGPTGTGRRAAGR